MNSEPRILVSLATYNESGNLPKLIEEIHKFVPAAHVLVVDDNSPDGTGKLADPTPGGVAIQATGSALTPQEAQALIDFHNKVRKEVGVGPVTWSPTIAKVAQAWADEQARTVKFSHRPNNKFGENLAGFGAGGVLEGANLWYAEKASYTPGTPIPADFNNFKAGHYSQMVWRNSTEFGAGKALYQTTSPSGWPRKGSWVLVGNYNPPGNYSGQKPY